MGMVAFSIEVDKSCLTFSASSVFSFGSLNDMYSTLKMSTLFHATAKDSW